MKLVHVVPHVSEEASGPSYSVPRLCQSLAALGHDVTLSCLAACGEIPSVELDIHPSWPIARRFAISPSHARGLRDQARHVEVVHNHSLWSMVNVAAGWVVPGRKAKFVVSPRGTLSPWALNHSRRIKQLMKPLQWRALEKADLLHATSEEEYREIRTQGFKAPVAIIPNGIDLPALTRRSAAMTEHVLLYLGRLHPIKGIDRLLMAWEKLESHHADWVLIIAGRGEVAHEKEIHDLAQQLQLKRVRFPGPLYGLEKSDAYFQAELFVLPTHSENFGMVVAEALAHGCPAIVSRGAPWAGLNRENCGWWISNEIDELTSTLKVAMSELPERRMEMGRNGRAWMEREFSWSHIGVQMESCYRWLVDGGKPPNCIRVD